MLIFNDSIAKKFIGKTYAMALSPEVIKRHNLKIETVPCTILDARFKLAKLRDGNFGQLFFIAGRAGDYQVMGSFDITDGMTLDVLEHQVSVYFRKAGHKLDMKKTPIGGPDDPHMGVKSHDEGEHINNQLKRHLGATDE